MNGHGQRGAPQFGVNRTPCPIRRSFAVDERDLHMQFAVQLKWLRRIGRSTAQVGQRFRFTVNMQIKKEGFGEYYIVLVVNTHLS